MPVNNGKRFPEFTKEPDDIGSYLLLQTFSSCALTRSGVKGPGNGTIRSNGKQFSETPFRTEKEDYLSQEIVHNLRKDFPEN